MSKPSSASKIRMTSVDDLFKANSDVDLREYIEQIPLVKLVSFRDHPFRVVDDDKMTEIKDSIEKHGVLVPATVRPIADGLYELVAGHRRKRACELLNYETLPSLVRNLDDDESILVMVDSNIQREHLLFSEKAFAYKMKLEAIKRKAGRPKNNSRQLVGNSESADILGKDLGESGRQIQRYIRLTELIPPLLNMVDNKTLAFNTAIELSYLNHDEQQQLLASIEKCKTTPSMAQASNLKKYSSEGNLCETTIESILSETSAKPVQVTLKQRKLSKYFPKEFTSKQMETVITQLLEHWHEENAKKQGDI